MYIVNEVPVILFKTSMNLLQFFLGRSWSSGMQSLSAAWGDFIFLEILGNRHILPYQSDQQALDMFHRLQLDKDN